MGNSAEDEERKRRLEAADDRFVEPVGKFGTTHVPRRMGLSVVPLCPACMSTRFRKSY